MKIVTGIQGGIFAWVYRPHKIVKTVPNLKLKSWEQDGTLE